ncbi:MAG: RsmE family RNA methyltransferase [Oscillospiraceae bacterium]|nr:RsmE family RNA methyltransferase [Oscillospiraceae bacterium]
MAKIFMAGSNFAGGVAVISGKAADEVASLRLKLGDEVIICDGKGGDHRCRISRFSDGEVQADVISSEPSAAEPQVKITVLAAWPKSPARVDQLVRYCTGGGAAEIVFFRSDKSGRSMNAKAEEKHLAQLAEAAEAAAKDAGRSVIPPVRAVSDFAGALDIAVKTKLPLFFYESGSGRLSLKEALKDAGNVSSVAIMTGPESGFEHYEAELAKAVGMRICSMGSRMQRCETAPLMAMTALLYETGEL